MTTTLDTREFQTRLERLEALLAEAERDADPAGVARTREIVQTVLDLHAVGLERLLAHLAEAGEAGRAVLDACVRDDLAAGLLLLHGLHPTDLETRVREALDRVQPYLQSHGGDVELLDAAEGVVRLRVRGSGNGCASSGATLRSVLEQAVNAAAPDLAALEIEGLPEPGGPAGLVQLGILSRDERGMQPAGKGG